MTQAVVASDANSTESFDEVLESKGSGLTFDDVFADWVIANYLDDPKLDDGRYGYERDEVQPMALDANIVATRYRAKATCINMARIMSNLRAMAT